MCQRGLCAKEAKNVVDFFRQFKSDLTTSFGIVEFFTMFICKVMTGYSVALLSGKTNDNSVMIYIMMIKVCTAAIIVDQQRAGQSGYLTS
jgi:hypothetical protein